MKDIEKLEFYASEESTKLKSIFEKLDGCAKSYSTSNTPKVKNKYGNLERQVTTLKSNRIEYANVLKKAIQIYDKAIKETIASAKKLEVKL